MEFRNLRANFKNYIKIYSNNKILHLEQIYANYPELKTAASHLISKATNKFIIEAFFWHFKVEAWMKSH